MKRFLKLIALLVSASFCLQASAATITVMNNGDSGAGSFRQALADANDGDTIDFSVSGTITLTSGELLVSDSVTITGPGADQLSVNGNAASRVFHISSGKTVTISGLTITNGSAGAGNGGGIWNDHATLTINSCTVSGNSASSGGGIFNNGAHPGGAIATINNSTISGNSGGGIFNDGATGSVPGTGFAFAALTVSGCTVSGNSLYGIHNNAKSNLTGLNGYASLTVTNSTISGNDGGISNFSDGAIGTAPLIIGHTVLASGVNIANSYEGTVTSLGYNLSSDGAGGYLTAPGDQINTDPMLGPLQDNGGPTFTMLPLTGSPAIDAGGPAEFDQRGPGYLRVINRIDIGAVEVQASPSPTPTPTSTPTAAPTPKAPKAENAIHVTATSFTANWHSVPGATGYQLDVATDPTFVTYVPGYQDLDVGNTTSRNITGLTSNTNYYYRLRAYNGNGTSPNSNVIHVKTHDH
jgi:hypothetical protein